MSVHLLTSVAGAPGVTTTALAWAHLSSAPTLILEADMTGGSSILAGPYRGEVDPAGRTVLALADKSGYEEMAAHLWWNALALPGEPTGRVRVVPTITAPGQARALAPRWHAIAEALRQTAADTGADVVIDYGRLSTRGAATPLLEIADTVTVLTAATMAGVNSTKRSIDHLREELAASGSPQRLVVAPVTLRGELRLRARAGAAARPWSAQDIAPVLAPTRVLPPVAFDPDAAAVYSAAVPPPRRGTRTYDASIRELVAALGDVDRHVRALAGQERPA